VALLSSFLGSFVTPPPGSRRLVRSRRLALALTGLAVGAPEPLAWPRHMPAALTSSVSRCCISPRFWQVQSWSSVMALPLLFALLLAKFLCVVVWAHGYVLLMTGARSTLALIWPCCSPAFVPAVRKPLMQWQLAGLALGVVIYAGVLFSFRRRLMNQQTAVAAPSAEW
jgi:hypothetical protein